MKVNLTVLIVPAAFLVLLSSCSSLDKATVHGFNSGYYTLASEQINARDVWIYRNKPWAGFVVGIAIN